MKYFVKLTFKAKDRPATFAQGGGGIKNLDTTPPAGFGSFREWASLLDGTSISSDKGLSAFVKLLADEAVRQSGASGEPIRIHSRGELVVVYYLDRKKSPVTLMIFTVYAVKAAITEKGFKFI